MVGEANTNKSKKTGKSVGVARFEGEVVAGEKEKV